jgi:hypothetical protein
VQQVVEVLKRDHEQPPLFHAFEFRHRDWFRPDVARNVCVLLSPLPNASVCQVNTTNVYGLKGNALVLHRVGIGVESLRKETVSELA